jgi:hypothetical protein
VRHLAVLAVALVAGCGSNSISFEQLSNNLQGAICQHEAVCGVVSDEDCNAVNPQWVQQALSPGDSLLPVIQLAIDANDPEVGAAVTAKVIAYNATNAQTCVTDVQGMSCDLTSQSRRVTPTACFAILVGKIAAGDACQRDEECASNSCNTSNCESTATCCTVSECQNLARSPVASGGACDFSSCGAGTYCDVSTKICMPLIHASAACDQTEPQCDYGLGCSNGVCGALPAFGKACTSACSDEDAVCANGLCTALLDRTQACGSGTCSAFYPCDQTQNPPVCAPVAIDGASCQDQYCTGGDFCNLGAGPNGGVCQQPEPDGTPCDSGVNEECQSGLCTNNGSAGSSECAPIAVCTGSG